jgi:error-prone DNA polymerase
MDVRHHLMAFERERVAAKGGATAAEVVQRPHGSKAFVVGNPLRLRFPPTRTGKRVVFFDLEDETGLLNVTCFDDVYQRYGHAIICNPYVTVLGEVQDRDGHMAFLGHHIFPYKPRLNASTVGDGESLIKTADFLVG